MKPQHFLASTKQLIRKSNNKLLDNYVKIYNIPIHFNETTFHFVPLFVTFQINLPL